MRLEDKDQTCCCCQIPEYIGSKKKGPLTMHAEVAAV